MLDQPRTQESDQGASYLGPEFSQESINEVLDAKGAVYEVAESEEDLCEKVAGLIADENVIGWFQGRMEFGPRALGGRSILGDPRSPEMQKTLNLKVKYR